MKVFGGNGKRQSSSGRRTAPKKSGSDSVNINNSNQGYTSGEDAHRGRREAPKPKRRGRGFLIALLVLLTLVACVFAYWKLTTKPPDQLEPETAEEPSNVERYYTLMVVGDDQEGGNTDTIMVMRFDTQEMTANVVSIPRDTAINTTTENKKINAVYHNTEGGVQSLLDQVERIAGFRPNNFIVVDMGVFIEVVDALGGVDFDVPLDMDYDDWSDHDLDGLFEYEFHIHLKAGPQTLSGYDALGVFRFRQNNDGTGYAMGDIQRLSVQHDLLMAIAAKAMNTKNVITLGNIATSVLDKCETDLSIGNIQWYIQEFMKMSLENISFHTAPTTGCEVFGTAYVTLNTDEWIELINAALSPYDVETRAEDCAILSLDGGTIDYRGYLVAEPKDFYCTNGEEVYTNFYKKR